MLFRYIRMDGDALALLNSDRVAKGLLIGDVRESEVLRQAPDRVEVEVALEKEPFACCVFGIPVFGEAPPQEQESLPDSVLCGDHRLLIGIEEDRERLRSVRMVCQGEFPHLLPYRGEHEVPIDGDDGSVFQDPFSIGPSLQRVVLFRYIRMHRYAVAFAECQRIGNSRSVRLERDCEFLGCPPAWMQLQIRYETNHVSDAVRNIRPFGFGPADEHLSINFLGTRCDLDILVRIVLALQGIS